MAGGEGDDQDTPLHPLNVRVLHRFCLVRALGRLQQEISAAKETTGAPRGVRVVSGLSLTAAAAASEWLADFRQEWVPRLNVGAHDEVSILSSVRFLETKLSVANV